MKAIRGIIFDKDGTLFDFERTWSVWADRTLRFLGRGDDALVRRLGQAIGFDTATSRFCFDSIAIAGTPQQVADALVPFLDDWNVQTLTAYLSESATDAPLSEVVPLAPLLKQLRAMGLTLGLVTNDSEDAAHAHLRRAGIAPHFTFVAGFDSGYGAKPAPGQLLAFARQSGHPPDAVLMVGDSPHDLSAARAAGMGAVGVLSGLATRAELGGLADTVLPDIGHLPKWLPDFAHSETGAKPRQE